MAATSGKTAPTSVMSSGWRRTGPLRYGEQTPRPEDGISEYRWATSVEDIHASLKMPRADQLGMVPILNSWDGDYPHVVWMPDETLDRLLKEDGEAAIVTRR
jgi:hypothetical protein